MWASSSAEVHAMNNNNHWPVSLDITETGGRTHAAAGQILHAAAAGIGDTTRERAHLHL